MDQLKNAMVTQGGGEVIKDTVFNGMDTIVIDSSKTVIQDSIVEIKESQVNGKKRKDTIETKIDLRIPDTLVKRDTFPDTNIQKSVIVLQDSVEGYSAITPCASDTSELWVYPDPSGGLHRRPQIVRFFSNRTCTIQWRTNDTSDWVEYTGGEIQIEETATLYFSAVDTCGRKMEIREEYYEIEVEKQSGCPQDMRHVAFGEVSFCVDTYEWPNRKGVSPQSYVSLYQAGDSCFSVGKRLCTAGEWTLACSGPYTTRYPYGDRYEMHACNTTDTVVHVSGGKPECRSYFGLYDMSGNLQEWTDSRAIENNRFYYVAGGFWDSGVKSSCTERRYSYYAQNRHNPVGFRCCKDSETTK